MGTSFLNIYRGFFIANLRVLLGPGNKNNTTNSDGSIHHHSDPKIVRKQFWSNYLSAATLKMPMDGCGARHCHLPHGRLSRWVVWLRYPLRNPDHPLRGVRNLPYECASDNQPQLLQKNNSNRCSNNQGICNTDCYLVRLAMSCFPPLLQCNRMHLG